MAPASAKASAEGALPRSAAEIAGIPVVFGPTAANPTRASAMASPSSQTAAPLDTTAQSPAATFDLFIGAGPVRPQGDADLDQHLGLTDSGLVRSSVEVGHRHYSGAVATADDAAGVESRANGGEVFGGIGLGGFNQCARKELSELFRWFHKTEGFARTVVEAPRDAVQVTCFENREVGPAGMYWRSSPFVFSFEPRCQGL